jgi:hypothetical protein
MIKTAFFKYLTKHLVQKPLAASRSSRIEKFYTTKGQDMLSWGQKRHLAQEGIGKADRVALTNKYSKTQKKKLEKSILRRTNALEFAENNPTAIGAAITGTTVAGIYGGSKLLKKDKNRYY